ncbi:segregation and condensation protein A [Liquorilactobacillus sicerae]|uniref:segregation and condensation protein A n=1 Tax=Liquorilactobacillus sicerae TaxID=1416943 RepID=UPI002480F1DA|nr:segregation/condensation protein A [Liquorilactobacillus sicerae]
MQKFKEESLQPTLKLTSFEGPLDLLLHLIKQNKMDIYDIKISEITSQYLAYLNQMQTASLKIAGEYFVMAATLLSIKSQMLLPKHEDLQDSAADVVDPRQELVDQLIAHQCFQLAADQLQKLAQKRQAYYNRPATEPPMTVDQVLPKQISLSKLERYYGQVLLRRQQQKELQRTRQVKTENFTIDQEISRIEELLTNRSGWVDFRKLFDPQKIVIEQLVTSFLALLELIKRHKIEVIQQFDLGPIKLRRADYGI